MTTARPFTPTREDPRDLDARTVGQDAGAMLDRIAARIDAAPSGNLAHTLVLGPRGGGKTHMLAVAQRRSTALQAGSGAVAVVVPEDAHGIVTYRELLQLVARSLAIGLDGEEQRDVGRLESAIREHLGARALVLVIENLDRLFRKLGQTGQHDLRAWVETSRKVLVLASVPMLFDGVQKRDSPWFGSFAVEPLAELTADEGAELLRHLRVDDDDLTEFLATPAGLARIQALHALTGGSPRLWTILADVVTVDQLDDLVPAVERLLEELVTYYQQRLWDLGENEERVVMALATGAVSQSATQLAQELGLDQRSIGSTMGRLAESRWIRGRKIPGTDQRTTWYELREPLLRHYVQYRTEQRSELSLIVEMLRHWFDPTAREQHLLRVPPASQAERYLGAALNIDHPPQYDEGYDNHAMEPLLLQARRWINDPTAPDGFADAGAVIEGALGRLGACPPRALAPELATVVAAVDVSDIEGHRPIDIDRLLERLAGAADGRVGMVLEWTSAAACIAQDPASAVTRLTDLVTHLDDDDLLAIHVAHDLAFARGQLDPRAGAESLPAIIEARTRLQGASHPDTLLARLNLIGLLAQSDAAQQPVDLTKQLLDDCEEALGPDHRLTLAVRSKFADYVGAAGDPAGALAQHQQLLSARQAAYGPTGRRTLHTRAQIAYYTGETGDPTTALALYQQLLLDEETALGPTDRYTLITRSQIAYCTGLTGDPTTAVALFQDLLPDREAALGPTHRDTLLTRGHLAYFTGHAGRTTEALRLHEQLLPDLARELGPDDSLTRFVTASTAQLALASDEPVLALAAAVHALQSGQATLAKVPGLEETLNGVAGEAMIAIIRGGRTSQVPDSLRIGVLGDILAAAEGSAEAMASLPPEVREIIDATRRSTADSHSDDGRDASQLPAGHEGSV